MFTKRITITGNGREKDRANAVSVRYHCMYKVSEMKMELANAVSAAEAKVKEQFAEAFKAIYGGKVVPSVFSKELPRIDRVILKKPEDLKRIYSGKGFYIILSNRPVDGNTCSLACGELRTIYRGECGTVRKRIQSHLFNNLYNANFKMRSSHYCADPKNQGRSFYEAHWPHCLKLDARGPSGIDVDQKPYSDFEWLVIVHRMKESSQRVRQLAEIAFDIAFGHPAGSRDT